MTGIPVHIATEDELSEVVLMQLLSSMNRGYAIGTAYGRKGFGYLKKTIEGWNRAAGRPIVILTDLDSEECPSKLIRSWLPTSIHPNLLLRVAVREVESWLLADSRNFAKYLRIKPGMISQSPDTLQDPKAELVRIALLSKNSDLRSRIVPKRNSTAKQGPDYNAGLIGFVRSIWDVGLAR